MLRFTPSQYNNEHHEQYSEISCETSHKIIGQEFDSVVVMIDKFFSYKGSRYFCERFFRASCSKNQQKLRDHQWLRLPRFVLVTSFRPNKGSKHRFQMTWRRFVKPAFSLRYASWKHMPYGYRGLKIFTSLSLRFQDFQRRIIISFL